MESSETKGKTAVVDIQTIGPEELRNIQALNLRIPEIIPEIPFTEEELKAGSCSYCPEGHTHSLVNTGEAPLQFLGVIPKLK